MARFTKGTPITYGTHGPVTAGNVNLKGVVALEIIDDSSGSDTTLFRGEMYASEIRLSYEADTNQSTNGDGEVVSHCTYNQRKVLNLTGVILSNNSANSVPSGTASTLAKANTMFAAPFYAGCRLQISHHEWSEVNSDLTPPTSENNVGTSTGGLGNFTITSAEKTRSSASYAEWSISAIEYLNIVHSGGSDTSSN